VIVILEELIRVILMLPLGRKEEMVKMNERYIKNVKYLKI